ncbi:MAG TPA: phosphomannomutase/phosphoglucomutase [Gammaproteobacteria bacterium]|nr:phosphomannomutase/phosphoglucomutase [Gammaproteobacteria bacterium]
MKLPMQPKGAAARPGAAATPRPGMGLARAGVAVFVLGWLALSGLGFAFYHSAANQLAGLSRARDAAVGRTLAGGLDDLVSHVQRVLDGAAADPALVRSLAGAPAARAALARQLERAFPGATVRVVAPGGGSADDPQAAGLSYAAQDLLHQAESGSPPPAEVELGQGGGRANFVRAIRGTGSGRVVADLLVSLPLKVLRARFAAGDPVAGYAVVEQRVEGQSPVRLIARGSEDLAGSRPAPMTYRVPASRWTVAYWPPRTPGPGGGLLGWVITYAVVVGLWALAVFVLFRWLAAALRADQVALIGVVKALRAGRPAAPVRASLTDCHGTLEMARQLARGDGPAEQAPARAAERPPENELSMDGIEVMNLDASIFRAYDIRGLVESNFTPAVVYEIGRAIGSEAYEQGQQTVIVGRDGRLSGPALADALIRGLQASGRDVIDIGQVPTPVLYFAAHTLDSMSGVMITGSHNPPEYNGMKIVLAGETLAGERIQALYQRIADGQLLSGDGTLRTGDVAADYTARITKDVHLERPLKVAVDCGNGVAGALAPDLLRALGCEVSELYCEVDGHFPNHHPDPSKTANLEDLIAQVTRQGADLGLAFDGDGDRLGVVDGKGRIIWPDRLMMLFAADILARNPGGRIIYDVKCSRHLDRIIADNGGDPEMWKTGHSLIKARMKQTGALLAGEMSGHLFFKERWYGFDDALYSAARLLEILARDPRSSDQVFAELPDSVNTPELNVAMEEGEPHRYMERLAAEADFEGATVSTIDGLRADFPDGWGLVRASNTTPCLVLRFEADNATALRRIQRSFRDAMLAVEPALELPF